MINTFSISGAVLLLLGVVLVLRGSAHGFIGWAKGLRLRREKRKLPPHLRVQERPQESRTAAQVGTGFVLAVLGAPLLWVGLALGAPFTCTDGIVRLAQVTVGPGPAVRVETAGGESAEGRLDAAILVARAETITFKGPLAQVGLGHYARLVSIGGYSGPRAVLERKGRLLDVGRRHLLFRIARFASRKAPDWVEVGERVSEPLKSPQGGDAVREVPLYAAPEGLEWRS